MTKIGIFTHTFYSEVAINNFRIPSQYSGGYIETNIINADPETGRGLRTAKDESIGLTHIWMPDCRVSDYSEFAAILARYEWVIIANPYDSFNWQNICERLPQSLAGRHDEEVLYFPSRLIDCFGEIQSKKDRRFPGNPYTWTCCEFPLTHFVFNSKWLVQISARIFPTGAMIASFYLGLLMRNANIIRMPYELGNTVVDNNSDVERRGMGLLRKELAMKVRASSCITRQKWGFPTPSNLTKRLVWV